MLRTTYQWSLQGLVRLKKGYCSCELGREELGLLRGQVYLPMYRVVLTRVAAVDMFGEEEEEEQ